MVDVPIEGFRAMRVWDVNVSIYKAHLTRFTSV